MMIMSRLNCISLNVYSVIWEIVWVKGTYLKLTSARTHSETGILFLFAASVRLSVTLVQTEISQRSHHTHQRTDPELSWCWQVVLIRKMTLKVDFESSLLQSKSTCLVRQRPLVAAVVITAVWKFGSYWQTTYSVVEVWGCVGGWWSFENDTMTLVKVSYHQPNVYFHPPCFRFIWCHIFSNYLICSSDFRGRSRDDPDGT